MIWREVHWPRPLAPDQAAGFLTALASDTARGSLIWEARAESGELRYLIGGAPIDVSRTSTLLRRLVPEVVVTKPERQREPVERAGRLAIRQRNLGLSLEASEQTLRTILGALSIASRTDDALVLQIVLGRAVAPELMNADSPDPSASLLDLLTVGPRKPPQEVRGSLRAKLGQFRFRATTRLGVRAATPTGRKLLVFGLLSAVRTLQAGGTRITLTSIAPEHLNAGTLPLRQPLRLTPTEAMTLLAWPCSDANLPGLPAAHPRRIAAPSTYTPSGERVFAVSTAPGPTSPVGIAIRDGLRHTHIYGPTGAGKSTLLLHLIAADIAAGRSVVVIDPKRDLGMDVLSLIPEERTADVAVLDPALERSVGINPFVGFDGPNAEDRRTLVADTMLTLFKGLFPSAFGPLTSDTLHAAFLTLTYAPGASLVTLPRLMTEPAYRKKVIAEITDPALLGFWQQYDAKSIGQQAAAVGPMMTRLRQFVLRPGIRAILEQTEPRFRLSDLLTAPRILVVTLNKGMHGPQTAELIGSLVVSQLWQLILGRAAVPESERVPISIYIDEAQSFLHLGDLGEALEQSRSLGAAWHLAHQYRNQMPDKLLRSIDANARNKVVFGLEDDEAATAARLTKLDAADFTTLPPYEIYTSLQNNGRRTGWFSARVLPPPKAISAVEAILAESQARYGAATAPAQAQQKVEPAAVDFDDEPFGRAPRGTS